MATPISARSLLASAPMSWTRVDLIDAPSALAVLVSVRYQRSDRSSYLLTSTVEIDPDTYEIVRTAGPQIDPITAEELCADVQRRVESGVGVRYQDLQLEAE